MTKMLVGVFSALLLATTAFAATNATVVVNNVNGSLYNAGEFGFGIGSAYNAGTAGNVVNSTAFTETYTVNFNASAFYFPWRNFGAEVTVPFYQSKGVSVQEVQVGLLARLPLAKTTPVFKNFAPYVGIGGVGNWKSAQDWAYIGKVGLEFRINPKWSIFTEGQFRNNDFNWKEGMTSLNGGIKLVF